MPISDIEFSGVTKEFGVGVLRKKTGVKDLSFQVGYRDVVGILGANGSGKSTTIKLMLGFINPNHGEIRIRGSSPSLASTRSLIGYLPENPRFQKFLRAGQLLNYYGALLGEQGKLLELRVNQLLEMVGLSHAKKERIGGFSKGMIQRLAIAQALLNDPKILIFDEPMSGLDPVGRREIRKLFLEIRERTEATIFFSSHILSDVEAVCKSVLLMKAGRLTRQCSVGDLLSDDPDRYRVVVRQATPIILERYGSMRGHEFADGQAVFNVLGTQELGGLMEALRQEKVGIVSLTSSRESLEDSLFRENTVLGNKGSNRGPLI